MFRFLKSALLFIAKVVGVLTVFVVVLTASAVVTFFAVPRFSLDGSQLQQVADRFLPSSMRVDLRETSIDIVRPKGLPFAKEVSLKAKNLCYKTEDDAIDVCVGAADLVVLGGWGGQRAAYEKAYIPRLMHIAPLTVLDSRVRVETYKLKKREQQPDENGFDIADFVRKQILPKWELEGSRIEIADFFLSLEKGTGYRAKADLTPIENRRTMNLILHQLSSLDEKLAASGEVTLIRPQRGLSVWDINAKAKIRYDEKKVDVVGHADVIQANNLKFELRSILQNVPGLRELRLSGALKDENAKGKISMKAKAIGKQVRALDFVDCDWRINLDQKSGAVRCGPQSVRLALREREFLKRPRLFVLAPEFDLRISRLSYGDRKAADFEFELDLEHQGSQLSTRLSGGFRKGTRDLSYVVRGDGDFTLGRFKFLIDLLRDTPYAVPAPLNDLNGPIKTHFDVDVDESRGGIQYTLNSRLKSRHQAMNFDLVGSTNLVKVGDEFEPETDI
ncbi:MAG TPA: hypothetical protein VM432_11545, partial [Bdellovibrionales bacterium]|nr:hypothetical protein [Bdellovibrionales bacterium]